MSIDTCRVDSYVKTIESQNEALRTLLGQREFEIDWLRLLRKNMKTYSYRIGIEVTGMVGNTEIPSILELVPIPRHYVVGMVQHKSWETWLAIITHVLIRTKNDDTLKAISASFIQICIYITDNIYTKIPVHSFSQWRMVYSRIPGEFLVRFDRNASGLLRESEAGVRGWALDH